jgi:hypothetical protein
MAAAPRGCFADIVSLTINFSDFDEYAKIGLIWSLSRGGFHNVKQPDHSSWKRLSGPYDLNCIYS